MAVEFNKLPFDLFSKIADRADGLRPGSLGRYPRMSLLMDLAAANGVNGNPALDLDRLMSFDDFNFAHDVFGIVHHMDRTTGKLGQNFRPRCAVAYTATPATIRAAEALS